ncbi:hypothetical protein F4803DRAFT_552145 [Xylaria telfairii]|nr:hypothetical protein F4803DRAFT_552145 [Xylaria telfairii]
MTPAELDPQKFIHGPDNRAFLGSGNNLFARSKVSELTIKLGEEKASLDKNGGLDVDVYTWKLLIVPRKGTQRFSTNGDSGAAIFDIRGYVVGIVTASNGVTDDGRACWRGIPDKGSSHPRQLTKAEETGVTFAAPIKWVLDDIQDFTGQRVRLA